MIRNVLSWAPLVAARPDVGSVWGRFGTQRPAFDNYEIVLFGSVILLLAGSLIWQMAMRRRQREFWFNSASRLFGELCRAHKVDRASKRLLNRLAAVRGLKNAAELFVDPDHFDMTSLPQSLKSSAGELRQLRHALFD